MNMFLFTRRYSCTLAPCRFAIRRLPPPRHHVHSADPRTFFLVDWCEYLHPVVSLQLPEVLSTHETSELTVRWPIIKMPQPEGPGIAVGVDYFDPLPVTPRGNTDIQLFTDRFSHRADMSAVTAAEFVAAWLTFSSTGMFPSGDSRAAYSRAMASSFAQRLRMPSPSFLRFGKLPSAPITQMATVGWSM